MTVNDESVVTVLDTRSDHHVVQPGRLISSWNLYLFAHMRATDGAKAHFMQSMVQS